MGTKRVVLEQNYEDYWKLTLEYSDIYSSKYNGTLRIIVNYIDKTNISPNHKIFQEQYKELQNKVYNVYPKEDMGSVRKSINQFIKLGFIKYRLSGYHEKTKKFLNETNLERKKRLFSEIGRLERLSLSTALLTLRLLVRSLLQSQLLQV